MISWERRLDDSVSTAILCKDGTCLCVVENNLIALPTSRLSNSGWVEKCKMDILELGGIHISPTSILRLNKIWLPGNSYLMNTTFLIKVTSSMKKSMKPAKGKFFGKCKWLSESDIAKNYLLNSLCEPTILEIFPNILEDISTVFPQERYMVESFIELTDKVFITTNSNNNEITLDISGLKKIQEELYKEYLAISFPSALMPPSGFCKFLSELGVPKDETIFIFKAADLHNRRFLSFRDFIYVLAALEPSTYHGGISGEVRCRYIFRYFDRDSDGFLNLYELKLLVIQLRRVKEASVDLGSVEKEFKAYCTSLNLSSGDLMSLPDFLKNAGDLKIRGLSQLFRLPKSVKMYMSSVEPVHSKSFLISVEKPFASNPTIPYAKGGPFEIGTHSLKIQRSGSIINVDAIWSLKEVASADTFNAIKEKVKEKNNSFDIRDPGNIYNDIIKSLKYLTSINKIKSGNRGSKLEQYQWGNLFSSVFGNQFIQVCDDLRGIIRKEPRLLDLKSPLYILGDFHGNFGDLLYFEKMLWPLGPGFCPSNLLFLGDYVDRGNFGVELIAYLFCYKVMNPKKIYLLRGNHELRDVQKLFTFYNECIIKFGEEVGTDLWEAINQVFDVLPLAAVIDGRIFCCHGGIPPPWLCPVVTAINSIPLNLKEPDKQNSLAWELMWNDPIRDANVTREIEAELKANEGFAANTRRGTAHVFNNNGLSTFLSVNGFSHVIRAHEMASSGYNLQLTGKLITVFSTSKYINNNEAASVLVDNGKIKVIRLDTTF